MSTAPVAGLLLWLELLQATLDSLSSEQSHRGCQQDKKKQGFRILVALLNSVGLGLGPRGVGPRKEVGSKGSPSDLPVVPPDLCYVGCSGAAVEGSLLEELLGNLGMLASVYHRPPASFTSHARPAVLQVFPVPPPLSFIPFGRIFPHTC